MFKCWVSGFSEKVFNCSLGNASTIKAYVAYDSLYLEEDWGPEWCQQENKVSFCIVFLFNLTKSFFCCCCSLAARMYERLLEKKNVGCRIKGAVEMQAKQ